MATITVQFKQKMVTGNEVVYSVNVQTGGTNARSRCKALDVAYAVAREQGINVNSCFHSFVIAA